MKKPYYRTCPYCGGNLDPDEKCDCGQQERQQEQEVRNVKIEWHGRQQSYGRTEESPLQMAL